MPLAGNRRWGITARIVIAVHQALVREAFAAVIREDPRFEVVGEAADGVRALEGARDLKPDILLIDREIPGRDAMEVTRSVREELPGVSVVLVSTPSDERSIIDAVCAGARGYFPRSADAEELLSSLQRVAEGGIGIPQESLAALLHAVASEAQPTRPLQHRDRMSLTEREKDVLVKVSQGLSNKEIAAQLEVSEHTVRAHLRSLAQKLGAHNRTQLAVKGSKMVAEMSGQ